MTCTGGCGYSFCPDLATLEGSSCTDIMTFTGVCGYSFCPDLATLEGTVPIL